MSIIQQIREKAAWLVFGLIALSLVGFLLMDAFVGRSRLFGNRSTVVGKINGEKIEYNDFQQMVSLQEENAKSRGYQVNDAMLQNIRDNVWKQMVEDAILDKNYAALGLQVTDREMNDMLVGVNAIPDIKQAFTDPKTGVFDAQGAAAQINQMRAIFKAGPKKGADNTKYEGTRKFFEESVPQIIKMRLREKYTALIANSTYIPKWMLEKMNADNSQIASISYVNQSYITVPDSTVKISDEEINDYVASHKDQFRQEESRSIAYVVFDAAPTSADSTRIRQQLVDQKAGFSTANNPEAFLARIGTEIPYYDVYVGKSKIQVPNKDSIFILPKGGLFGPYLDAGNYVIAKKIDEKVLPDSVKARHILVSMIDLKTRQPSLDDSTAKRKIDSIKTLIDRGARFDSLAAKLSDDPGSKEKGGDLGYFTSGQMVKEFNDFCFNGKTGEKKIVKTEIGYHYVEILDQKGFEPAYKVAYLSKKIDASAETDQAASGLANQFAGESRNIKAFDQNVQKGNLQKLLAPDVQPSEAMIPGLGFSRQLVHWINDASVGDVSEPFSIGDKYVVATLTEINKEGTMPAAKARSRVEPILRNRKKADMIVKKVGTPATLEAAASATGQSIRRADSILFSSPYIPNAGQEGKVVGASFDKQLAGKPVSGPIQGNGGVYVIKVEGVSAKSNPSADMGQQRFAFEQQQRSMLIGGYGSGFVESLKRQAKITDNRGKFY